MGGLVDGGFAMGSNLPLFAYGESEMASEEGATVTTSTGETKVVPKKADFGTRQLGRALLTWPPRLGRPLPGPLSPAAMTAPTRTGPTHARRDPEQRRCDRRNR